MLFALNRSKVMLSGAQTQTQLSRCTKVCLLLQSSFKVVVCSAHNIRVTAVIDDIRKKGDSCGGEVTCIVRNCPKGLGAPVFGKLEAELAGALMSLPASKVSSSLKLLSSLAQLLSARLHCTSDSRMQGFEHFFDKVLCTCMVLTDINHLACFRALR